MIYVAVLGYGVVGSGVVEVIKKNTVSISKKARKKIVVKKILDIRDFEDSPDQELLTKNADEVFEDDTISVIIETIGGVGIAHEFTKRAFKAGKHVVTSNKELVATHGPELLDMAKQNSVNYLFEASVGGGIPIIRPLEQCLSANEIDGIMGILNGTTNYILSQMKNQGMDFDVALKNAQINGYAEADPTADIEGHDACRKIAILSSLAYHEFVDYRHVYTEGITKITRTDMQYAENMNAVIKLIGMSKKIGEKILARVSPVIINKRHPLSNVEDVFNAIVVKGDALGDAMFYGRGAGKMPTASAVVADVIDIVKHLERHGRHLWERKNENNVLDIKECETAFFVRVCCTDKVAAEFVVERDFGKVQFVQHEAPEFKNELAFVTERDTEKMLQCRIEDLAANACIASIINTIRVEE